MIFKNIWELLYDMRVHGSNDILCADNPQFLLMGWICVKTEKMWEISISDYRSSVKFGDSDSIKILNSAMLTDRAKIIDLLDKLPLLERLNKLKAFY